MHFGLSGYVRNVLWGEDAGKMVLGTARGPAASVRKFVDEFLCAKYPNLHGAKQKKQPRVDDCDVIPLAHAASAGHPHAADAAGAVERFFFYVQDNPREGAKGAKIGASPGNGNGVVGADMLLYPIYRCAYAGGSGPTSDAGGLRARAPGLARACAPLLPKGGPRMEGWARGCGQGREANWALELCCTPPSSARRRKCIFATGAVIAGLKRAGG